MDTFAGFNEITVSFKKLQGRLANPELILHELGREIEEIATEELQRSPFKHPLSPADRSPIQQKPFSRYRSPFPEPSFGNERPSILLNPGVSISRLTQDSVTVAMPREVVGRVHMRLPEIEQRLGERLTEMLGNHAA
jgi:hypothetical protein